MSPPRPGTPLGTSTMTPRPNRSGPCCSERGAAAGAARVTVSPTTMTIQLILYRGKRDNEEYTEILKSKSKRPQANLPRHELLSPLPFPPPNQHPLLDTRCGWLLGDTAVGRPGPGRRDPGKGSAGGAGSRVPMARGHLGERAAGAPVPILVPKRKRRKMKRRRKKYPCGSALTLEETAQSHLVDF